MYSENYVNYVLRRLSDEEPIRTVQKSTRFFEKLSTISHIYNKIVGKDLELVPIRIDR